MNSPRRDDWQTPVEILTFVWLAFRGQMFDLDPFSAPSNPTRAKKFAVHPSVYDASNPNMLCDGFVQDWNTPRNLFVNPPFSRREKLFAVERLFRRDWSASGTAAQHQLKACLLVPASVGAKWWQEYLVPSILGGRPHSVVFLNKRVRFRGAASGAMFDTSLVFWGPPGHSDYIGSLLRKYAVGTVWSI